MCSFHTSALVLLVYISGHAHGQTQVRLNIANDSRIDYDIYFICLSDDSTTRICPEHPNTRKMWASNINAAFEKGQAYSDKFTIQKPWTTKQKYFVISTTTSDSLFGRLFGRGQSIDISHLTLKNGTLPQTTILDSLLATVTLACSPNFYTEDCSRTCLDEPRGWICNRKTGEKICIGNRHQPLLHCICKPGWTGGYCNVSSIPSTTTALPAVEQVDVIDQVKLTSDCQDGLCSPYSSDDVNFVIFILVALLLAVVTIVAIIGAVVLLRRARQPCQASSSLQSSHFLLTIDDDVFTEKMLE